MEEQSKELIKVETDEVKDLKMRLKNDVADSEIDSRLSEMDPMSAATMLFSFDILNAPMDLVKSRLKIIKNNNEAMSITQGSSPFPFKSMIEDSPFKRFKGIRERRIAVDFYFLRAMSQRGIIIPAIHNTRLEQIYPFSFPYDQDRENPQGYRITLRNKKIKMTRQLEKLRHECEEWVRHTGYTKRNYKVSDPELLIREDDFSGFLQKLVRETLTIDQQCIEFQSNKREELIAFRILDGATVKKLSAQTPEEVKEIESMYGKGARYVQEYEGMVKSSFTRDQMLFDFKNKRTELDYSSYGYSALEQLIDVVTSMLFAFLFNKQQFTDANLGKGFFTTTENVNKEVLLDLQRQWQANYRGIKGAWKIPIFGGLKDLKWSELGASNREMEFNKYLDFLMMMSCATYNISVDEMGIRLEKSSPSMSENVEPRIAYSKDRGLRGLLTYAETVCNKILERHHEFHIFKLEFVGLFREDKKKVLEEQEKELDLFSSLNELRKRNNFKPLQDEEGRGLWWAEIPFKFIGNAYIFQYLKDKWDPEMPSEEEIESQLPDELKEWKAKREARLNKIKQGEAEETGEETEEEPEEKQEQVGAPEEKEATMKKSNGKTRLIKKVYDKVLDFFKTGELIKPKKKLVKSNGKIKFVVKGGNK